MTEPRMPDSSRNLPRGQGYPPPPGAPPHRQDAYPGNNYAPPPGYAAPNPQQPYNAPPGMYPVRPAKPTSGKAIASLVIGGVCVFFWPVAILAGPVGFWFGMRGMKESKQPNGRFSGWGLGLAGTIMSAVMFVMCVGIGILFVGLFAFAGNEMKHERARQQEVRAQERAAENAEIDMYMIEERLYRYYIDNNRSLGPGGPIVRDGEHDGLYPDDHPKVEGELKLTDLVRDQDLHGKMSQYSLKLQGDKRATIRATTTGDELMADYNLTRDTRIKRASD